MMSTNNKMSSSRDNFFENVSHYLEILSGYLDNVYLQHTGRLGPPEYSHLETDDNTQFDLMSKRVTHKKSC